MKLFRNQVDIWTCWVAGFWCCRFWLRIWMQRDKRTCK